MASLAVLLAAWIPAAPAQAAPDGPPADRRPSPTASGRTPESFANVGYGPLALPSQSPLQALRFGLSPPTPSPLARGHAEFSLAGTWVNVWAVKDSEYALDYEMLQSTLAVRYAIDETLQIQFEYSHRSRFGGRMDGLVQGFHDLAGLDQDGRDGRPRGDFKFVLGGGSGPGVALHNDDRGTFSESLLVSVRRDLFAGTDALPALCVSATLRGDLRHDPGLEGPPVDAGIALAAAKGLGAFYAYLGAGFTEYGGESFRGVSLRPHPFALLAAVEWKFAEGMSAVLQYLASQGVAEDLRPFSRASHELTLGWRGDFGSLALQVGLIENLFTFDNSPDFGVHVGATWRL